jgi:membrane protein implicated in regulation of membrane protease activity
VLIYIYLATLIFGGVLLGTSILLGGHGDMDADIDADLDLDLDVEMDLEADTGFSKDFDFGDAGEAFFWPLKSVRFWTFFSAFFGLTGLALEGLGLMSTVPAFIAACTMGVGLGWTASSIIRRLARDDSGRGAEATDYVGKTARVIVPVKAGGVGKVRVRIGGQNIELLAVTDEEEPLTAEDDVLVLELDGTRARVVRLNKA